MDMQEFLNQYAENTMQAMVEGRLSLDGCSFMCELCPLKAECAKDTAESEDDDTTTCAQFIARTLTNGRDYKL